MAVLTTDRSHMLRALRLASRGRGRTAPNPMVGAVLVRNGEVVGEGWHRRHGGPHAEVEALAAAGRRARGATLYVTLEPCAHHGKTPPCTEALVAAGVKRCVVAVRDPHAIVNGRGLRRLRAAGIAVEVGLCADEACELLGGYVLVHRESRPRVTWKAAASLDGRIADHRGRSQWITGPDARRRGHGMRAAADAIVVGANTARTDDPRLTARLGRDVAQPLRVVCDTSLRLPLTLKLFRPPLAAGTVVACGPKAPGSRVRALEARGVRVWRLPLAGGHVSPRAIARRLAAEGRHEVLLEGGATLGGAWLRAGLVDRIALFVAPRLLGDGTHWLAGRGWDLAQAPQGRIVSIERAGSDALLLVDVGGN
ncbi:MAG: bifunctional diaminohydroxyphosphoribosylaminopyrimidine deaminase/5-amino-6-(5-phosphoribosylamino)uracil reductase RibD [Candidatus Eisenbacteria bacterium]|uniref:Riboflavin biosynthesis protein RibD n=1 Tax=Eiseniibacteriota bacterium TaxID=2212470 RepID=A0A933SCK8_UNCEI|nr:bifunctional diaminohydroxyphosphoribosylaminopyrimidine deaminase/5-amino-6-(5-phosphoribosylamino)uracil reductase RibD [Candidatus Eisenbacteria bacterium]